MLIDDKHRLHRDRYLFVSSRIDATSTIAVQLQHTTLSKCLTKTCKRTGIFQTEEEVFRRMTCSRIRFSVIMELVSLDEDNLDNIAFCFGKHSKEVCKKSYVQFWSTRATARLSWKCHQIYNTDKEKKAVELRENILENKTIPEVDDIEIFSFSVAAEVSDDHINEADNDKVGGDDSKVDTAVQFNDKVGGDDSKVNTAVQFVREPTNIVVAPEESVKGNDYSIISLKKNLSRLISFIQT